MTNDLDILKRVHFVEPIHGIVPRDFQIDPTKVHKISSRTSAEKPKGLKTYRYVIAISGNQRQTAAHEFHDRVLNYPTAHGIFALYSTQRGTAATMLGVNAGKFTNTPDTHKPSTISKKDIERIESFKSHLLGHRMLIIRGAFANEKDFVEALTKATQSRPGDYSFTPRLPSLVVDMATIDSLHAISKSLKTLGNTGKKIAPNVPVTRLVNLASDLAITSADRIEGIASQIADRSINKRSPLRTR